MADNGSAGTPLVGAYPAPPYPGTRPGHLPTGIKGPDDGDGVRRKGRRALWGTVALVLLAVVVLAGFLATRGGGAVTGQAGLTADLNHGKVLRPAADQHWTATYDRGSGTYQLSGLRAGDTFSTTMVITNAGKDDETVGPVTSVGTDGTISGITPGFLAAGKTHVALPLPTTITLSPGQSTSALLVWKVASCTAASFASPTVTSVDVAWSSADRSGTTTLPLAHGIHLVDAPSCS